MIATTQDQSQRLLRCGVSRIDYTPKDNYYGND